MKLYILALLISTGPALAATVTPQQAASHMDETVTIEGVASVHIARNAAFLDMGGEYPNEAFQAVAFQDSDSSESLPIKATGCFLPGVKCAASANYEFLLSFRKNPASTL